MSDLVLSYEEDVRDLLEDVRGPQRSLAAELVAECRTCTTRREVRRTLRSRVRELREEGGLRLDPATILLVIQLAIAVWKLIKELRQLNDATPETVLKRMEALDA